VVELHAGTGEIAHVMNARRLRVNQRNAGRASDHCCLDTSALRFLDRLSPERHDAGFRCAGYGAQPDCPALCGGSDRLELGGFVGAAVPVVAF
jgi:hypothetical protein